MATLKDVKRNMENLRVYLARELETANQLHAKSDEYHPAIIVAGNNLTECDEILEELGDIYPSVMDVELEDLGEVHWME